MTEKPPQEVIEMLQKIEVLEKDDSYELTGEFYRRWKKLQIALDKMSPYDKSRMISFQEKQGMMLDSSQTALAGAIVPPEGLKEEWMIPCMKMVEIILDKTIPAWKIPE